MQKKKSLKLLKIGITFEVIVKFCQKAPRNDLMSQKVFNLETSPEVGYFKNGIKFI